MSDDFAAVGTCLFVASGEPGAEAAVAICVAAGDNVGFVHEAFADLADVELSQAVKVATENVQSLVTGEYGWWSDTGRCVYQKLLRERGVCSRLGRCFVVCQIHDWMDHARFFSG